MPQLDTVYTFTIFLWTWLMIYLMTQKIKTMLMTSNPTMHPNNQQPTQPQLWL